VKPCQRGATYESYWNKPRNPSDYTRELSRRAHGVNVWAALRSLVSTGLATPIERPWRHARRFAEGLAAAGYQVLNDVVLERELP